MFNPKKANLSGWKPDRPDVRDKFFGVDIKAAKRELPEIVDLRQWTSPIEDQSQLGSCTAQAIVGAMEYNSIRQDAGHNDLSRLFLYYNEREMEGTVNEDAGAYIRDGIKSSARVGVCHESLWPHNLEAWNKKPTRECYIDAQSYRTSIYVRVNTFENLFHALADGFPIVFGATLYESFMSSESKDTGIIQMPRRNEATIGGHAMLMVGYDKRQKRFIIRNSWGEGWGVKGHGFMPFGYFQNVGELADDLWIIKL